MKQISFLRDQHLDAEKVRYKSRKNPKQKWDCSCTVAALCKNTVIQHNGQQCVCSMACLSPLAGNDSACDTCTLMPCCS